MKKLNIKSKFNLIKSKLKSILKLLSKEEMLVLPGNLTYYLVLSMFAFFTLLGVIGSSFFTQELINSLESSLPSGVTSVLESLLNRSTGTTAILIIMTIYLASGGPYAMIITSNSLYKIKNSSFIKRQIKSIIMTVVLVLLFAFIILVPAFGDLILNTLYDNFKYKIFKTALTIFTWLKYPLSIILIFIGIKILYTMAPDESIPSKHTTKGAFFTTILWILITRGYAIYLNHINTYNFYYGSLANIVILLFWIFLLSNVFTIGIALNAEAYHRDNTD